MTGVVDLPRRAEISQAANGRYLTTLAEVDSTTPLSNLADRVGRNVMQGKRRFRGLNPMSGPDAELAAILLRGEFALNGFRNRDLCRLRYGHSSQPVERRRQSTQLSRHLRLFREHRLIRKVKGSHRDHLTAAGRRILPAFTAARSASSEELNKLAL